MSVVATDLWLKDYQRSKRTTSDENMERHREFLCEKLTSYFTGVTSFEIQNLLFQYGLFLPDPFDTQVIETICQDNHWSMAEREFQQLKAEWSGPDIPIFIFPSNFNDHHLKAEFGGKSGLAFKDKIFLFIPSHATPADFKALITHEYNHVCRLHYLNHNEDDLELLDAIVLEGLAETAVKERVGEEHLMKWTSIYSIKYAKKGWNQWLKPNLRMKRADARHLDLMYGGGESNIPKWIGYNVGYYLVSSFIKREQIQSGEALYIPAARILEGSAFS